VREEHGDLGKEGSPRGKGLLPGRRNAHDDVAEQAAGERAELTLVHRERQDVRRSVFTTIEFVQFMNSFIVS